MDDDLQILLRAKKQKRQQYASQIKEIDNRLETIKNTNPAPHVTHSPENINAFYADIAQEEKNLTKEKSSLISKREHLTYEIDLIEKQFDHPQKEYRESNE